MGEQSLGSIEIEGGYGWTIDRQAAREMFLESGWRYIEDPIMSEFSIDMSGKMSISPDGQKIPPFFMCLAPPINSRGEKIEVMRDKEVTIQYQVFEDYVKTLMDNRPEKIRDPEEALHIDFSVIEGESGEKKGYLWVGTEGEWDRYINNDPNRITPRKY